MLQECIIRADLTVGDVGARARIWRLSLLVAFSLFLLVEGDLQRLYMKQATLYFTFLVVQVLTRAWTLIECLLRERRIEVILPGLTSNRCTHERSQGLAPSRAASVF